jgi:hypothetical protein
MSLSRLKPILFTALIVIAVLFVREQTTLLDWTKKKA